MNLHTSNLKEEIAKRYTLRYTFNKLREKVSEFLWMFVAVFLAFGSIMIFGGHILARCIASK